MKKNILYSWSFNILFHTVYVLSFLQFVSGIGLYGDVLGGIIWFLIIKTTTGILLYKVISHLVRRIIPNSVIAFGAFAIAYTLSYFFVIAYTSFTESTYIFWRLISLNPPENSQLFFYSVYKALGCSWLFIAALTITVSAVQKKLNESNKQQVLS